MLPNTDNPAIELSDQQLLRYSRQIMLPQIEFAGQQKLLNAKVMVIGLGGLGSPVAMYLAAAGVGHLTLVDDDRVDLSNLQRQIIHDSEHIGSAKVESAMARIHQLNPDINADGISERLTGSKLTERVEQVDAVIDASDNFATRFALNDACVAAKVPLISGAAIRMEGQITVFRNDQIDSPCYRCLYRDGEELDQTCSENGVLAPIVGIVGSVQALETIKVLLNLGETLTGRLLLLDGMTLEWRELKLKKDPDCPVCGNQGH